MGGRGGPPYRPFPGGWRELPRWDKRQLLRAISAVHAVAAPRRRLGRCRCRRRAPPPTPPRGYLRLVSSFGRLHGRSTIPTMGTERRTRVGAARSVSRRAAGGRWAGSWRRRGGGRYCPHPPANVRTCRQTRGHTAWAGGARWRGWRLCQRASEPLLASWWCGRGGGGGGRYGVASASLVETLYPLVPTLGDAPSILLVETPARPSILLGEDRYSRKDDGSPQERGHGQAAPRESSWTVETLARALCGAQQCGGQRWLVGQSEGATAYKPRLVGGARLSLGGGGQGFNRERSDPRARAFTPWPCSVCAVERSCLWTVGRPPPPGRPA